MKINSNGINLVGVMVVQLMVLAVYSWLLGEQKAQGIFTTTCYRTTFCGVPVGMPQGQIVALASSPAMDSSVDSARSGQGFSPQRHEFHHLADSVPSCHTFLSLFPMCLLPALYRPYLPSSLPFYALFPLLSARSGRCDSRGRVHQKG